MQPISPATIARIQLFTKAAVESGSIPRDELDAALQVLRKAAASPDAAPTPRLLSFRDAARALGCGPKTISRLVRANRLRTVYLAGKSPKSLRVIAADVAAVATAPAELSGS